MVCLWLWVSRLYLSDSCLCVQEMYNFSQPHSIAQRFRLRFDYYLPNLSGGRRCLHLRGHESRWPSSNTSSIVLLWEGEPDIGTTTAWITEPDRLFGIAPDSYWPHFA